MQFPSLRFRTKALHQRVGFQKIVLCSVLVLMVGVGIVHFGTRILVYEMTINEPAVTTTFPVGVDPAHKRIVENPEVGRYFAEHVSARSSAAAPRTSWIRNILSKLALKDWYQNLASPTSRILVILPGERKEEVAEHFGSVLGWDMTTRHAFMEQVTSSLPVLAEGKFAPHTYTTARGASHETVAALVIERFTQDILSRYSTSTAELVPLADALTIASLLEREGRDFDDMRQISGIIWNRLFSGMKLQLDATLQYARGSKAGESWWPQVAPADKHIASAFNTYKHFGLPPAPIANPSLEAILAALNPKNTECMFYFHSVGGEFHCSVTYAEHIALLKQYYGRGR